MCKVTQVEVFPRGNSILGDSAIPKVAPNGVLVEGFGVGNSIGVQQFAQNDVLVEGFGPFGTILGIEVERVADAP